ALVGRLDKDLGRVPGAVQYALDREHFVADGITVAERREDLMDLRHRYLITGPRGARSTISRAGRTSRFRSSNQPGSGAMAVFGGSLESRSNRSRYFFSITDHEYCRRKYSMPLRPSTAFAGPAASSANRPSTNSSQFM